MSKKRIITLSIIAIIALIFISAISSTISSEMQRDAVIAVIIATICMLIYSGLRFNDIRFGASAIIALLHDVLVVLAVYALLRISVGNTFIANCGKKSHTKRKHTQQRCS